LVLIGLLSKEITGGLCRSVTVALPVLLWGGEQEAKGGNNPTPFI
jgi:hypothetical protein